MHLFFMRKILGLLVMPIGLIWLGLLTATWLCWRRGQRRLGIGMTVLSLFYTVVGNPHTGFALMASLERQIHPVDIATLEPFDAVCVLGGGSEQDPSGRTQLGTNGDRIVMAARLWYAGKAKLLVASGCGDNGPKGSRRDLTRETRDLWLSLGIPGEAIRQVEEPCWTTHDEIQAYGRMRKRYGWTRVALISSASHLPRALAEASKVGLDVVPIGSDWRSRDRPILPQDFVPQAAGFENAQCACWEYVGRLAAAL